MSTFDPKLPLAVWEPSTKAGTLALKLKSGASSPEEVVNNVDDFAAPHADEQRIVLVTDPNACPAPAEAPWTCPRLRVWLGYSALAPLLTPRPCPISDL